MKKDLFYLLSINFLILNAAHSLHAQEPLVKWEFYFAFEDATGAKDTVWTVLHENGTSASIDTNLGEIPVELDTTAFNVWIHVYPSAEPFKKSVKHLSNTPNITVFGMNAVLPMTLSWDTALFNAPVLQATEAGPLCNPRLESSYLENFTNANWLHNQYSIIFDTHVLLPEAPWLLQPHFPMRFYTDRGHNCDPLNVKTNSFIESVVLYPNPCTEVLNLRSDAVIRNVEVYNLQGQLLLHQSLGLAVGSGAELRLDVRPLPPGMYLLQATAVDGRAGMKKFLKSQ